MDERGSNSVLLEPLLPRRERLCRGLTGLRIHRKTADTDAVGLEHDDAALVEIDFDRGQIRDQKGGLLFRPTLRPPPEQHDGGEALTADSKERPKVGVGRHDHSLLFSGAVEDLTVTRRLHAVVSDMRRIVAGRR